MELVPCLACSHFFTPRNRLQSYCTNPECQKARKATWQRNKKKKDPEYGKAQRLSHQKWLDANPGYWKEYRISHPEKTARNRLLQKIRNKRRVTKKEPEKVTLIAKMDARKPTDIGLEGEFWFIPVIAKMDAAKINFHLVSDSYRKLQR